MKHQLTLTLAAGLLATPALAQDRTPTLTADTIPSQGVTGHIYFNIATNERIVTTFHDDIRPSDSLAYYEQWVADNSAPCAVFGIADKPLIVVDNPNGDFDLPVVEGNTLLDWADISSDSVINCVQLSYFTTIPDTDLDSNSLGDGVEGFAVEWAFYEEENGFNHCSCRMPLVNFMLMNLPGQIDPELGIVGYMVTIDLDNSFSSAISFEIGDTDGSPQGAAIHNPFNFTPDNPCSDLDSNGLADFGYSIHYVQPGTIDLDNADGDNDTTTGIDGDIADKGLTALTLAHYRGETIETDHGDGTFSYEVIPSPGTNATGAEDGYDVFDSSGFHTGTFWAGGFTCNDPDDGEPNAFAQIELTLYGVLGETFCVGDIDGDGDLDINDVNAFIAAFLAVDLAIADFDGDGDTDINDVNAFIAMFLAGCP
jgi:hypothetical protein